MALAALCGVGLFPLPPGICGASSQEDSQDHRMALSLAWAREEGILLGTGPDHPDPRWGGHQGHGSERCFTAMQVPLRQSLPSLRAFRRGAYYADAVSLGRGSRLTNGKTAGAFCPTTPPAECAPFSTASGRAARRAGAGGRGNITIADFTGRRGSWLCPAALTWAVGAS